MAYTGGAGVGAPGKVPTGPRPTRIGREPPSSRPMRPPKGVPGMGVVTSPGMGVTGTPKAQGPPATSPTTPGAPPVPPSGPGTPGYPSPYDSTYYTDLAGATNKANQQIGAYNADIANGGTALQSTLAQLAHNQALATTNAQNAENTRGGFAQGALGQTIGNVNRAYLDTGSADQLKYSQNTAAWNSAIAGVQQGLSIEQIALAAAAAARQSVLTGKSGGAVAGVAGPGAGAPPGPAPGATGTAPAASKIAPEPRSSHSPGRAPGMGLVPGSTRAQGRGSGRGRSRSGGTGL